MFPVPLTLLRSLFLAWALLTCLAGVPAAHAKDHIAARSWLEDPTGQMSLAQVQQLSFQPFQGVLNRGYGTGVVWLRLRIDPHLEAASGPTPVPREHSLVLRIRPAYLDEVTVFDPLATGGVAGVVGDRYHPRLDAMQETDFLLPIAGAPRDIWLRLATTSTRQIHVTALQRNDSRVYALRHNLASSFYIGVVLVLLIWGTVSRVLYRERVMGAFALMQLTAGLYGLSTLGILRAFWPLNWSTELLNSLGSVFSIVVVTTGLWFHVRFLREFRPAAWAMGLLYAVLLMSLLNLAMLAAGQVIWALQGNMLTVLLAPPVCLACAATGRAWQVPDGTPAPAINRPVLVAFYAALLVIFLLASTTGLGLMPATEWTIYVSQLHGLVIGVLLLVILQYRNFVSHQQRQQALLTLEATRLQVIHERQMREEQERLLLMLAHEIKTPLATMHLRLDAQAKGAHEVRKAMREMNAVIERCLQTLKMGDGQLRPYMKVHDLADVVRDALTACSQPDRVRVDAPVSLRMAIDPLILFIVLSNLLENACDYSAPGSPIALHCAELKDVAPSIVRLEISNLVGQAGWPDAEHVFDKYYRAPQAQRQSGTGLGLYLARNLARALGGQLTYEPDATQVRFVLTLPMK